MKCFKLSFPSGLHVESRGSGEPDQCDEYIRSDTLSAALCVAWDTLQGGLGTDFFLDPPFTLSSAFPYIGSVLFFPLPVWNVWQELDDNEFARRKEQKKIRWLSRELFDRILTGRKIDLDKVKIIPGGLACTSSEQESFPVQFNAGSQKPWMIAERQRIMVDRLGLRQDGGLFFFSQQFFAPDTGLFFLVNCPKEKLTHFRAVLQFLGDSGLGGDRNSGVGHFKISSEENFIIKKVKNSKKKGWFTLSLVNPGPEEIGIADRAAYNLTRRSGWIHNSTLGRPPVQTFSEGSFFKQRPQGRIVEMISEKIQKKYGLPHSAPRDFRSLVLPCVEPDIVVEVLR